jgi:glycyl-tRNA synthetase beta chain
LVSERNYMAVLAALATLREPVDGFFDGVLVMADNLEIRENRLALLYSLRQLFLNVADISHLVVSK